MKYSQYKLLAAFTIFFAFMLGLSSAWAQTTKKVDRGVPYFDWWISCEYMPECQSWFPSAESAMQAHNLGQMNKLAYCMRPEINQSACSQIILSALELPKRAGGIVDTYFNNGTPYNLIATGVAITMLKRQDGSWYQSGSSPWSRNLRHELRCTTGNLVSGLISPPSSTPESRLVRCMEDVHIANDDEVNPNAPPVCKTQPELATTRPISPATGQKMLFEADYTESLPHPFEIKRTYIGGPFSENHAWVATYNNTPIRYRITAGLTDWRWHHSIQPLLIKVRTDLPTGGPSFSVDIIRVHLGDGISKRFRGTAIGGMLTTEQAINQSHLGATWIDMDGADELLVTQDPNLGRLYTLKRIDTDKRWVFDDAGRILRIIERNGWAMNYAYSVSGRIQSITNAFGRQISFTYNDASGITQLNLPDGRSIVYQGNTVRFADNTSKTYLYENASYPAAITGVLDENGNRFSTYAYDTAGRAISSELAGGVERSTIQYPLSSPIPLMSSQSIGVTDPLGTQRLLRFTSPGGYLNLLSTDQASANSLALNRVIANETTGLPQQEIDFLGNVTYTQWNTTRRLKTSEQMAYGRPEVQNVQTQWHPTFRLPTQITEQGKTTAFTHDAAGNILTQRETDTTGAPSNGQTRTWVFTYATQNLPLTMTDPRGQAWTFAHDAAGNRASITNPLGHISSYTYDGAGRVLTETAPNGLVTSYQYDPRGRVTRITRGSNLAAALQQITIYTYRPSGQIASATLPNGHAISYTYDDAQRLIGASDNRGNSIAYVLDPMGNRTSETVKDASQQIALASSRVINSINRVEAIKGGTNPSAQTTAFQYDANGEPIQSTDALGNVIKTTLDALRRPTATTLPDNSQAKSSYNQLNQVTAAIDPKAVQTSFIRNAWGEVLSETSPDIGTVITTRDAAGNPLTMQDAKGQLTSYQYDALSRITNITFADSKQHNYSYDGTAAGQQKGMLREMQDASGNTKYERDTFGRITKKTQTVSDNPVNPTVLITQYTYDKSELASIRYPSGLTVAYPRNASGQITGLTTKIGTAAAQPFVQNLSYTALGQPKAWNWAHCTTATTAISPCTSAIRTFDADARMTASSVAAYKYDAAGRITAIPQNLFAQRSVPAATGTATVTQLYQQPISWTIGYDNRDRITSFARIPASGSIPAAQQSAASEAYTYDPNSNRLSSITLNARDTDKDGLFEFSEQRQNTTRLLNVPPTSNKLLGFTQTLSTITGTNTNSIVTTPIAYTLDANGNLVSDGLRDFRYDASDRLSKVILGTTFVGTDTIAGNELAAHTYLHNAAGQRVFKSEPKTETTVPNSTTLGTGFVDWLRINFSWLWQTAQTNATLGNSYQYAEGQLPSWALLGEYGNGGSSSTGRTEYIWLPTQDGSAIPIGMYRGGKFYAIHSDHLGTPRLMVDNTNQPVWQWAYSGFGDNAPTGILKPTTSAASAFTSIPAAAGSGTTTATLLAVSAPTQVNNLRMLGQYFDSETGHFYNTYRTLMPSQGRYTQPDPIALDGGWNQFGYVNGNPLMATDPYGLFEWPSIPQPVLDFSTGVADAASLGLGPLARNALGIDGGVDQCSDAYSAGQWSSLALGGGRVLYAGVAKAGSAAAASGAAAMEFRNGLKRVMRGPLAGSDFRIKNYAELLRKYGSDDAVRAAAGRTSPAFNSVGANLTIGSAVGRATCGCPR